MSSDCPRGSCSTATACGASIRAPSILFTHDNYIRDYLGFEGASAAYGRKKVVLLVRHPADIAVSGYFHWRHRMTPNKRVLNGMPPADAEISLPDYVLGERGSLRRIIRFLNRWAAELGSHPDMIVVRYADLRAAPEAELGRILSFLGHAPAPEALRDAVEYASLENMRRLETSGTFAQSGRALRSNRTGGEDGFKVRRARVGGYHDYFSPEQIAEIDAQIAEELDPVYGYHRPTTWPRTA